MKSEGSGFAAWAERKDYFSSLPEIFRYLSDVVWFLAGPLTSFMPSLAGEMVCVKRLCWI